MYQNSWIFPKTLGNTLDPPLPPYGWVGFAPARIAHVGPFSLLGVSLATVTCSDNVL